MIVDDAYVDRYVAKTVVKTFQFAQDIVMVESAHSALEILSAEPDPSQLPQIIFLDINMPEMDGFGFLEEFGRLTDVIKQTCKIVMLTSSSDNGDIKRADQNPYVFSYILKPLDKSKLDSLAVGKDVFLF